MLDLYQTVTDRIVAQLEAGTVPWVRPWNGSDGGMPHNAITRKPYRGINTWILYAPPGAAGDGWMTYKQAQGVGAQVRKGERGSMIVFFKPWTVTDKNAPVREDGSQVSRSIPVLRNFTVFHTSQIDNLPDAYQPKAREPIAPEVSNAAATALLSQARVQHGGDRAFYSPAYDVIQLPAPAAFRTVAEYFATGLHELTHWSGHSARLAREYGKRFGDSAYAREELVAEMGAAYLCAASGIEGRLQHAEYLANWISVLKSDKRAIVMAAGAAQKAADFLQGKPAFVATDSGAGAGEVAA